MVRVRNVPLTFRQDYASIAREIIAEGQFARPRDIGTFEILNYIIFLNDGRRGTFVNGIGRNASYRVLSAELMQWVAGISDLTQLKDVSPFFGNITDDGERLYGAYGPRTFHGFSRVVSLLARDPSSRQGTVSIWNNTEVTSTADLPCTVSWSFIIRNRELHMTTFMRSNDLWLGAAYDLPIMCRIQSMIAWVFGVNVGTYTHHAQSMHVYERDLDAIQELRPATGIPGEPPFFDGLPGSAGDPEVNWRVLRKWAMHAYLGRDDVPEQFRWYSAQLRDTKRAPHLCTKCRYVTSRPCNLH